MQSNLLLSLAFLCLSVVSFSQETIVNNGGFSIFPGAEIGVFSDFKNDGIISSTGGTVYLVKDGIQDISGSSKYTFYNLVINNSNGVTLRNQLEVQNLLTFLQGIITTDKTNNATQFVHFLDNATTNGASNLSHVDGVVVKTGNDAFNFPVGNSQQVQILGISAPESNSDSFVVYYTYNNPDSSNYNTQSMDNGIVTVSKCEYWLMKQANGSSCVNVTLDFDENSCGVYQPNELLVSSWDGSTWTNLGNQATSGSTDYGTVESSQFCGTSNTFTPFTLASSTINNPLPVELLNFNAVLYDRKVYLNWQTASENNNDYFLIEKSQNGVDFEAFDQVDGAGTSTDLLSYSTIDENPFLGTSYYRLKQVDFNGEFSHSETRVVVWNDGKSSLLIYPNPSSGIVNFVTSETLNSFQVYASDGKLILDEPFDTFLTLDLPSGVYTIQYSSNTKTETKKIVITN